jgi:hypothetical protein
MQNHLRLGKMGKPLKVHQHLPLYPHMVRGISSCTVSVAFSSFVCVVSILSNFTHFFLVSLKTRDFL